MPFFQVNPETRLYFIDEHPPPDQPAKSTCVLIHGWACDLMDWIFLIPYLTARGHRVIAYDQRGHGKSTVPPATQPQNFRMEVIADDGVALLKHLITDAPLPKFIVFGHSAGGLAASVLATRHQQLVKALVLIDPVYHRERHQMMDMLPKLASMGPSVLVPMFAGFSSLPWMQLWHRTRLLATPHHVVYELSRQKAEPEDAIGSWERCKADFGSLESGCKDLRPMSRLVVFPNNEKVAREEELGLQNGSEVVVLAAGGHWPHQQSLKEFWQILSSWLNKRQL